MIVNRQEMQSIEKESGLSVSKCMEQAGNALACAMQPLLNADDHVFIVAGKGNNGGDSFVLAKALKVKKVSIYLADGTPSTKPAKAAYAKCPAAWTIQEKQFSQTLKKCTVVIDAVYGFGFHGSLTPKMKQLFEEIRHSSAKVWSIDINSGGDCDGGACDAGAMVSDITFTLDCYKPFHMLRKNHNLFSKVELVSCGYPHTKPSHYTTMDASLFLEHLPKKKESAYKGTFGKTVLVGGCMGMAGAVGLNILGAQSIGASYLQVVLPESIYPILATNFLTPVFHPFTEQTLGSVLEPLCTQASSIGFGSGAVYMDRKNDALDLILQTAHCPIIFDAEALRLLVHNTYVLRFAKGPVILTPHLQEFSALSGQPIEVIQANPEACASAFAKQNKVYVVLKGPHTIVVSPTGECYINQSGNQALAQAGSGDVLTGILTTCCGMTKDLFTAITMAVWFHGHLADLAIQHGSIQTFDLRTFPSLANAFFFAHER